MDTSNVIPFRRPKRRRFPADSPVVQAARRMAQQVRYLPEAAREALSTIDVSSVKDPPRAGKRARAIATAAFMDAFNCYFALRSLESPRGRCDTTLRAFLAAMRAELDARER